MFFARQAAGIPNNHVNTTFKFWHLGCRSESSFGLQLPVDPSPFLRARYRFKSPKPTINSLLLRPRHKLCAGASAMHSPQPLQYNCSCNISVQPKIKKETETVCTFGFSPDLSSILLLGHMLTSGCWEKADPNSSVGLFQGRIPHKPWRLSVQTLQTQDIVVGGWHWFSDFKFPGYSFCFFYSGIVKTAACSNWGLFSCQLLPLIFNKLGV